MNTLHLFTLAYVVFNILLLAALTVAAVYLFWLVTRALKTYIRSKEVRQEKKVIARTLGEALRRIAEGAAMIRTKGEPGTGNVVEAVRHCRQVMDEIRVLCSLPEAEVANYAKEIGAPLEICLLVRKEGRLPVVNFAAGGIATPADAAMMMHLGCDGVFVGSGIFKSGDPAKRARAIVQAVTNYKDYALLAEISRDLGEPMVGIDISTIPPAERMQERGW